MSSVKTLQVFNVSRESFVNFTFVLLDFTLINKVFPAAVAIAFLAILEVSSISRNFAGRSGQQVQANQDALGLGLANTILSFLSGAMPISEAPRVPHSITTFMRKAASPLFSAGYLPQPSSLFACLCFS